MSYQVLARKWRPRFFREMVGQEHVLQALINALDHNRLHHAYLFTGTRGVGKTTIARILAKCLNCETGVSSEPCGQCTSCLEIGEGRFIDLIEVDAASNTGVDDVRDIIENAQYRPTRGRYKVYIIDEVHMLSKNAFNALLKTLEEPPEHVKFLLATTDPQKLPATILSRCLQFHLKNMSPERIVGHLQNVLGQELVDFDEPALWALARSAEGSMRDALSLTDQAIAFGSGKVMEKEVRAMLGSIDQQTVYQLAEGLLAHDAARLLAVIGEFSEQAPDYPGVLDELLLLLHRMTIAQVAPDAVDNCLGDRDRVLGLAQQVTAEELQLFYQMGLLGKRDMNLAPDLRTGLEMAVLRMLVFRPQGVAEPPSKAINNSAMPAGNDAVKKPEAVAPETVSKNGATALASLFEKPAVVSATLVESVPPAAKPLEPGPVVTEVQSAPSGLPLSLFSGNEAWVRHFSRLPFTGLLKSVLAECVLENPGEGGTHWRLLIDTGKAQLFNEKHAAQMADMLTRYFGQAVQVTITPGNTSQETPAQFLQARKEAIHAQALAGLLDDAAVQFMMQTWGAEIIEETVEAIHTGEE